LDSEYTTERNKHRYISWTSGEISTLVSLYNKGDKKTAIAQKLGRSRHSVSRKLDKLMASGDFFKILGGLENDKVRKCGSI
jgi:DNA-binding MarR family transcriptional regulator